MATESNFVFHNNVTRILINFGKICRFCLSETENEIFIKDVRLPEELHGGEEDTIYSFMTRLNIFKMSNAETFPSLICKYCYEVIKICYNFFKVCEKSENVLNDCYEKAKRETREQLNYLSSVSEELTDTNTKVINVKTNQQGNETLEYISKAQEVGREQKTPLILEIEKFSGNIKCSNFSDILVSANETYCCCFCSIKFSSSEALNHHHIHSHEKRYMKMLNDQDNLTTHKIVHNKQNSELPWTDIKDTKNFVDFNVKANLCSYCSPCKKFQTREDLLEHMNTHAVNFSYSCPYCEDKFFLKLSLSQHLVKLHNLRPEAVSLENVEFLKQEHIGIEGDKVLHSVADFLNFYQDKIKNFRLFCKNCNPSVKLSTKNDFITHMVCHHSTVKLNKSMATESKKFVKNNSKWKCSDCLATYSQKQSLSSHVRQKHNKEHLKFMKCPVCFETFPTNRKVIQHGIMAHQKYFANVHKVFNKITHPSQEAVTQNKNFECDICQKKYIFKTSLKKHIFSVHLREAKDSVACPYCGKTLASKLNLKSHIEFKHEALFVSCPICKKTINFRTIGRHYKVHENASEVDPNNSYLCTQCGKILKSKRSFEDHQKIHKNIRNELCDVCGGGYATKKALRLHKKTHEGVQRKFHECDQCDKVFTGRHSLNRHLLTHSGVKNFICEICSKCFYTLQELNRHVRYHKKQYRFECQQCDMRFVDKSRFRHHLMKHKNIRPYKCEFCEKMFIVKGKMNLHMASKHNVQVASCRVWKDPKAYIPLDELLNI